MYISFKIIKQQKIITKIYSIYFWQRFFCCAKQEIVGNKQCYQMTQRSLVDQSRYLHDYFSNRQAQETAENHRNTIEKTGRLYEQFVWMIDTEFGLINGPSGILSLFYNLLNLDLIDPGSFSPICSVILAFFTSSDTPYDLLASNNS